ncbi:Legumain [Stylophora pistillata]|uniref:Legumain n=1 Tax=Stylophora pistillata TaxID=50429 RepID=A0A2B4SF11_STYPI|nr:Legumain [Stylophora pistillata]
MAICGLSLHLGNTKAAKLLNKSYTFKSALLIPQDFDSDILDEFQGDGTGIVSGKSPAEYRGEPITDAIPAPDVELNILHHRLKDSASLAEKRKIALEIEDLIERNEGVSRTMESIVQRCTTSEEQKTWVLKTRSSTEDFECYKQAVKTFSKTCYSLGQSMQLLLPTPMNARMPATMTRRDKPTLEMCTLSSGWKTLMRYVHLSKGTLLRQFQIVKQETNTSHLMQYGDLDFDSDILDEFQGDGTGIVSGKSPAEYRGEPIDFDSDILDEFQGDGTGIVSGKSPAEYRGEPITDAIPAPDVELNILHHRLKDSASLAEKRKIALEIEDLIERNEGVSRTMESIVQRCTTSEEQKTRVLKTRSSTEDFECYKQAVKTFSKTCYSLGQIDHALRHV